jgi:hypothetical protein
MRAAAGITPPRSHTRQVRPGATVRDLDRERIALPDRDESALRGAVGEVGTADQVAVP